MKAEKIATGRPIRQFELFEQTVLEKIGNPVTSPVTGQSLDRNLKTIRYAAVIVILTNAFWLVSDILRGGALNLSSGPALAAVIVHILFSSYMLALPALCRSRHGSMVRYSFLAYYICLIIGVTVLIVTKNVQMLKAGTNYSLAGISLSTCYLFILILAPLPSARDSIILGVIFFIVLFIPVFLPGREMYSLAQQSIIRVCMGIAYWYVRNVNKALDESIERLSVLSFTDPLTGVLNRRALDIYWHNACDDPKITRAGILIYDIDNFKKYNDHYTHSKGDDVLIGVCFAVTAALEGDARFVFRYGGEEFVVVLPDCTEEEMIRSAQRINKAVFDAGFAREDGSGLDRITVTIGCTLESTRGADNCDFITNADIQLYIGKNHGKNCVVCNDQIYRP